MSGRLREGVNGRRPKTTPRSSGRGLAFIRSAFRTVGLGCVGATVPLCGIWLLLPKQTTYPTPPLLGHAASPCVLCVHDTNNPSPTSSPNPAGAGLRVAGKLWSLQSAVRGDRFQFVGGVLGEPCTYGKQHPVVVVAVALIEIE